MVSLRCKMLVQQELEKLGIAFFAIDLGKVELPDEISSEKLNELKINLARSGLEILDNKKNIIIEKIKNAIAELIHQPEEVPHVSYSEFISSKLNYDYTYLSNLFSEVKGITIQQYIIINKIERVKELLLYDELNLTEISYKLNYCSVAHLSNQFKKITGLTPSYYKKLKQKRVRNLEDV
ncbi:MAG: helix-turn-helix transcriptional regulator [Bacteroidetes bacterium]|nr:helix-turn-helix transcriptional regulator [Bacteroidota bacterium]